MKDKFEPTPEMKAKIEERIKEYEAKEHKESKPLNLEELDAVSGGGSVPFDPDREINGWNFHDLYYILCWICEAYHDEGNFDRGKYYAAEYGCEQIQSIFWYTFVGCDYPTNITEPMTRIWTWTGFGPAMPF